MPAPNLTEITTTTLRNRTVDKKLPAHEGSKHEMPEQAKSTPVPHSFRAPSNSNTHGFNYAESAKHGPLRMSGKPDAHCIGRKK